MVDKADYVLGVDPAGKRTAEKLLNRLNLFYAQVEACASDSEDAHVLALATFGRTLATQSADATAALLPKDHGPGDLFMFRVGTGAGACHDRPGVRAYWKKLRNPPESPGTADAGLRCLITGQSVGVVPLFKKIKNIPGDASGGLSLISFNSSAWESHGWTGEDNAPVSRAAAEAAATALNRLLDPRPKRGDGEFLSRRSIRLSDDTAVVFWSPEPARDVQDVLDFIPDLMDPEDDVADVGNLFAAPKARVLKELKTPARFYAMTLTSMTGRVIVRDWLEATVAEVQRNLRQYFDDLACVRNTPRPSGRPPRGVLTLNELMAALAAPGRERKIPAALAANFFDAALRGTIFPFGVLQRALLRHRAEIGSVEWDDHVRRDARVSLTKAVLNRARRFDPDAAARYPEVRINMDPDSNSIGYRLGMLLAVIERLQTEALNDVNASVVDKFFAAASATPRVVFDRILKNARHHARKGRDDNPQMIFVLERLLDEIMSHFKPAGGGIPTSLPLEQQGLFIIGYHHMRKYLWMNREERDVWEAEHPGAPKAYLRKKPETAVA
jgi:CRISPR-associated protein Csd1